MSSAASSDVVLTSAASSDSSWRKKKKNSSEGHQNEIDGKELNGSANLEDQWEKHCSFLTRVWSEHMSQMPQIQENEAGMPPTCEIKNLPLMNLTSA